MITDKDKYIKEALEVAETNQCLFLDDVVSFLPISRSAFFEIFPVGSNEKNDLKTILNRNRLKAKRGLRKKWYDSENATLQLSLYKLICSDKDREKLRMDAPVKANSTPKDIQISVVHKTLDT